MNTPLGVQRIPYLNLYRKTVFKNPNPTKKSDHEAIEIDPCSESTRKFETKNEV